MRLTALARDAQLTLQAIEGGGDVDPMVTGVTDDSRRVRAGDLFVAYEGRRTDGRRFVTDALAAGAVAVCAGAPVPGVPTLVTSEPRLALARLAAAMYRHPARELPLVGITGSLGKTSTALLMEACLAAGHRRVGIIGSLGVRARGQALDTQMTTPGAPVIHAALRFMADEHVDVAVMEVTSHGILLERVAGLTFDMGLFTNLVPDEHLEFHPTPEHYIRTKLRFLEMLRRDAPLVYNWDDARVRAAAATHTRGPVIGVSLAGDPRAPVRVADVRPHAAGSDFCLVIQAPLRTLAGQAVPAEALDLRLPLLGHAQVGNAAFAAVTALLAGVPAADVRRGLAGVPPIRRRMEIVHAHGPLVVDDTVGHPRSIAEVQALALALPGRPVRAVYAVRGTRGAAINASNASALADFVAATGAELVLTESADVADARNRVTEVERDAARTVLDRRGVAYAYEPELRAAVRHALAGAPDEALVLLLGAQGMDEGARFAREVLGLDGGGR
ncbi:MAG TPA: Mur ligase family protein [Gemmatimonadaceae bacterium]|nr:Mur ligase family protein [Gemmatimonadaceae bacterium]